MRCIRASHLLQLYIDQRLSLEQMRRLERHLADCDTCHTQWQQLEEISDALSSLKPVMEPTDLTSSIMQRIALNEQRKQARARRYALLRLSLLEALLVIVLATLTTFILILGQPTMRASLPFAPGIDEMSRTALTLLGHMMSVSSNVLLPTLWIVGTILGVFITLIVAGHEMRAVWFKAMSNRLSAR